MSHGLITLREMIHVKCLVPSRCPTISLPLSSPKWEILLSLIRQEKK